MDTVFAGLCLAVHRQTKLGAEVAEQAVNEAIERLGKPKDVTSYVAVYETAVEIAVDQEVQKYLQQN